MSHLLYQIVVCVCLAKGFGEVDTNVMQILCSRNCVDLTWLRAGAKQPCGSNFSDEPYPLVLLMGSAARIQLWLALAATTPECIPALEADLAWTAYEFAHIFMTASLRVQHVDMLPILSESHQTLKAFLPLAKQALAQRGFE